jgi:hypothetical protein
MPWADDLLKTLTPEQKRQLAETLAKGAAWLGDLAAQIGQGRAPEVPSREAPPEQAVSQARTQTVLSMEADIQAIKRSGHRAADTLIGCVQDAYAGKPLPDDIWAMIARAIAMGSDVPVSATSDNLPYVSLAGMDKPTNGTHRPDVGTSHNSPEWPRKAWLQMPREHYDYIRNTSPESGSRSLMMAQTYELPSTAVAVDYNDDAGIAYVTHASLDPVEPGKPCPMFNTRSHANATIP